MRQLSRPATLGLENTEERYHRKFVTPLYGTDDHRYHLPVDEEEAERAEIGHTCWLSTTSLLCVRTEPVVYLGLGAGAGAWVQEVAQMKPNCKVVGIDLYYDESPETPNQAEFEVDDCELPFAASEESVALGSIRDSFLWVRDLKTLLSRVHGMLRPNGCFQCQEVRLSEWNSNKPKICHWRDEVLASASDLGIQHYQSLSVRYDVQSSFLGLPSQAKLIQSATCMGLTIDRRLPYKLDSADLEALERDGTTREMRMEVDRLRGE